MEDLELVDETEDEDEFTREIDDLDLDP